MSDYIGFQPEPDINRLIIEIFRINGALISFGDELVRDLDLTSSKWQVLGSLSQSENRLSMPAIALNMGMSRQGVRVILKPMIEAGLVRLTPNPLHKRSPHVTITALGAKVYSQAMKRYRPIAEKWGAQISGKELKQAFKTLGALLAHVNSQLSDKG